MVAQLTAENICDIIRTCRKHNVSSLKFQGLSIRFGEQSKPKKLVPEVALGGEQPTVNETLDQDLDLLMVEDPAAYEKMLQDNQLPDEAN